MARLFSAVTLFLVSLLTVVKAPTYHLWMVAIIVTEYCIVFILLSILMLCWTIRLKRCRLLSAVFSISAFCMFLNPIVQAKHLAKTVRKDLQKAFNSAEKAPVNFSLTDMLTRGNTRSVEPESFIYTSNTEQKLTLDFYKSRVSGVRPCVIVIHGGSWRSGDNKQLPELNSYLAHAGYHVAAINYRLAPRFKSPLAVEDVFKAFEFLKKHAGRLNIDSSSFVLLGRSAGAQIALLAAYKESVPGLRAVIDFYGPADMVWGYSAPANPFVMDSRQVMEDYLGGTYQVVPENYNTSSPLRYVTERSVPTLIIHGENDVLVAYEHSVRLGKMLRDKGIPNYFLSLPWATHGFDFNINGPGGQLSTATVKYFIEQVTR